MFTVSSALANAPALLFCGWFPFVWLATAGLSAFQLWLCQLRLSFMKKPRVELVYPCSRGCCVAGLTLSGGGLRWMPADAGRANVTRSLLLRSA